MDSDNKNKHYPGYFIGKNVRVEKSNGGIVNGHLREITVHQSSIFLVVELVGTSQDQIINVRHVISIEEGVN